MSDASTPPASRVRLETNANSLKAALLSPFASRYRALRQHRHVPEPIRITLDSTIVTPDRKLYYVKSSKVAGTSVSRMLYRYAAGPGIDKPTRDNSGILHGIDHWRDYLSALEAHAGVTFTLVRNPLDRCLSAFRDFFVMNRNPFRPRHLAHMRKLGYSESNGEARNLDIYLDYVELSFAAGELYADRHWRKQVHNLAFGHIDYDHIGRVENLEAEMLEIFDKAGIAPAGLIELLSRKLNNTDTVARIDPSAAQIRRIETLYADDFSAFGY